MYVPVDESYPDHAKTARLCAALKCDTAGMYPIAIWCWALRARPSGQLVTGDAERATRWRGKAGRLEAALLACGFIDQDLRLHGWDEWAGPIVAKFAHERKLAQERKARHLAGKRNGEENGPGTLPERSGNASGTVNGTVKGAPKSVPERQAERSGNGQGTLPERLPARDAPAREHEPKHEPKQEQEEGEQPPPPPVLAAQAFVRAYQARLFPAAVATGFDPPAFDVDACQRLLAAHAQDKLERLVAFVAGRPYWRKKAGTVGSFARHLGEIESEAFAVPDEPLTPDAAIVRRELDARLRKRDPGLALEPPGPADRAALNALVAKYGRDRVRFILRTAMESDHFSKRVYDVDTLARHAQTLVAESAELWASAKDELHDYLDPIPQEATA